MPTESPPATNRETWLDWMPEGVPEPENLLTRDEVLNHLAGERVTVSEDDLQNWQQNGIVPYGVRRRHPSSRTGRMLYPWWMAHVLRDLRILQADGRSLRSIVPRLRQRAADYARQASGTPWQPFSDASISGSTPNVYVTGPPNIPPSALAAAIFARLAGTAQPPKRTEGTEPELVPITVTSEDGSSFTVSIPKDELAPFVTP